MLDNVESMKNNAYKEWLEKKMDLTFLDMGKEVFQLISEGRENSDLLMEKYNLILELKEEIQTLEIQMGEMKKTVSNKEDNSLEDVQKQYVCPKCKQIYTKPVHFCKMCGTNMSEVVETSREEDLQCLQAKVEDYVCPNCGAHFDKKTNFCRECGSKMNL